MILALDLGTNCGWAVHAGGHITSGVWNLKGGRFEGGGMRFVYLRKNLLRIHEAFPQISQVAYEEVRRHMGVDAAHIYGGCMATLTAWCEEKALPYRGIPVGTIKKHATGKGNATKDMMVAAARAKWPGSDIKDDNEADARWIADFAALAQ